MSLRIGFDAKRFFHNQTGLGNYSRTLIRNLVKFYPEHEYFLFTPSSSNIEEVQFVRDYAQIKIIKAQFPIKSYWRSKMINRELRALGIDIYHGLSHEIPISNKSNSWKTVVTIHDLIHKVYPNQYKQIDRWIYERKFKYSCAHADRIIAISESTKKDIISSYKVNPEKIQVLYQTCSDYFKEAVSQERSEAVKMKYKLPQNYFIFVGSIIERKNLQNIIKAYQLLDSNSRIPLIVVGSGNKYQNYIKSLLREYNLESWFHFISQSSLLDLPALYANAQALIYPSLYEGFGIPVIEAIYQNCPVITSRISSMPEAGGEVAYYVNPDSPSEIATRIKQVLNKEIPFDIDLVKGHLAKFDAEHLSQELVQLYTNL